MCSTGLCFYSASKLFASLFRCIFVHCFTFFLTCSFFHLQLTCSFFSFVLTRCVFVRIFFLLFFCLSLVEGSSSCLSLHRRVGAHLRFVLRTSQKSALSTLMLFNCVALLAFIERMLYRLDAVHDVGHVSFVLSKFRPLALSYSLNCYIF